MSYEITASLTQGAVKGVKASRFVYGDEAEEHMRGKVGYWLELQLEGDGRMVLTAADPADLHRLLATMSQTLRGIEPEAQPPRGGQWIQRHTAWPPPEQPEGGA